DGNLHMGADPVTDPLAGIPEPSPTGSDLSQIKTSGSYPPGYYSQGISVGNNQSVTLQPGVYVLGGGNGKKGGITVGAGGSVTGNGVMLFLASGGLSISAGGSITLSPPTSGTYKDLTIFQSRTNGTADSISGNGNSTNIQGTLYFPAATLNLTGT